MDRLLKYGWPGNVRELMNTVERAVVLSRSEYLDESDLSLISRQPVFPGLSGLAGMPQGAALRAGAPPPPQEAPPAKAVGNMLLDDVERDTILKTLDQAGGNKSEAARRLGITRRTLHQKLKRYGMM